MTETTGKELLEFLGKLKVPTHLDGTQKAEYWKAGGREMFNAVASFLNAHKLLYTGPGNPVGHEDCFVDGAGALHPIPCGAPPSPARREGPLQGTIEVGEEFIWEPFIPSARAHVRVTKLGTLNGEPVIYTEGLSGHCGSDRIIWNYENRFRQVCYRVPKPAERENFFIDETGELRPLAHAPRKMQIPTPGDPQEVTDGYYRYCVVCNTFFCGPGMPIRTNCPACTSDSTIKVSKNEYETCLIKHVSKKAPPCAQ